MSADSSAPSSPTSSRESRPASLLQGIEAEEPQACDQFVALAKDYHAEDVDSSALRNLYIVHDAQSIKSSTLRPFLLSPFARDAWPPRYDAPLQDILNASSASAVFKSQSAVNVAVYVQGSRGGLKGLRDHHPHVQLTPVPPPTSAAGLHSSPAKPKRSSPTKMKRSSSHAPKERLLPVVVQAKSVMSYVTLSVPSYPLTETPLQIRARTLRKACTVIIPPEFSGIVSWSLGVGQHGANVSQHDTSEGRGMGGFKLSKGLRESGRVVDLTGRLNIGGPRPKKDAVHNLATDADVKKALRVHAPLLKKRPNRGLIKVYPAGTDLSSGVEPPPLRGDLCELVTASGLTTLIEYSEVEPNTGLSRVGTSAKETKGNCVIA